LERDHRLLEARAFAAQRFFDDEAQEAAHATRSGEDTATQNPLHLAPDGTGVGLGQHKGTRLFTFRTPDYTAKPPPLARIWIEPCIQCSGCLQFWGFSQFRPPLN